MAFKDLREYISKLEQEGELLRIKEEVDWNLEVSAIIRRSYDLQAPAPLFENIKGYPKGFRILGAPVSSSASKGRFYARLAISLGLPPDTDVATIIEELAKAKHVKPLKPKLVKTGPCKENIQIGREVNLFKLPVPYIHPGDGGRYIGTWHTVVTRDPDTGWTNWGMYRLMVHDETSMGGPIAPSQHIGMHYYEKYEARNQPMPFAVAIGTEPLIPLVSCFAVPPGTDEADIVGAMRGEPVEVVKCETVDLEVPATSEIVIEGMVLPHQRKEEGPFGEYTGYITSAREQTPIFNVTAITHRNDPILPVICTGAPVEDHLALSIAQAADILDNLRSQGLPVKKVFIPPHSALHIVVISTETPSPNIAQLIANVVWANKSGACIPKIIVIEDDIDATNMDEVLWVFCTRNHPDKGIHKIPNPSAFHHWTFLSPKEKKSLNTTNVLFDCTWPKDWPKEFVPRKATLASLWPKDIQEKVLARWESYGYSLK